MRTLPLTSTAEIVAAFLAARWAWQHRRSARRCLPAAPVCLPVSHVRVTGPAPVDWQHRADWGLR